MQLAYQTQPLYSCKYKIHVVRWDMSKDQKLMSRLLSRPKNFTYNELCRVLNSLGYEESQSGKTSGSRVAFIDKSTRHIIRLHKPHPSNELKQYQIEQIVEELKSRGLL